MKQVAQRAGDGQITVEEVPLPGLRPGWILVATRFSLISAGTERSKIELGGMNLTQKARARPDLVRKVIDRARVEGIRPAFEAVRDRLDGLAPLGYSAAGIVLRVGDGVDGLSPGDPVACGGQWANHAEVLAVPRNLVAKVPQEVSLDVAAYATVGAIALHALRRAEATVGERVGVIGLGLVGQLAVRLLGAAGCNAIGIDPDEDAVALASAGGAAAFARDEPGLDQSVFEATDGFGLDAVLVCAATHSPDPIDLAAHLLRNRGRIVVVGDVPVEVDRAIMYDKELELRLSRSYGPGRYDRGYEEHGRDLPPEYVRWTERRNIQAFVDLLGEGRLNLADLTTHRLPVERAVEAYETLSGSERPRPFGILLEYDYRESAARLPRPAPRQTFAGDRVRIGLVGAGSFARSILLPGLKAANAELVAVVTAGGLSAADVAARFDFERTAGSTDELLDDESLDALVIATRHNEHAALAASALRAGKSVFVEKPLALNEAQLADVESAAEGSVGVMMVGFNRRFAPLTERLLENLPPTSEQVFNLRVNAGPLPADHWLHDIEEGGGRLVGEGCHFIDLLCHLAGSEPLWVHAIAVPQPMRPLACSEHTTSTLRFASGAIASFTYASGGNPRLPKERLEVFGGGVAAVLDDFRRLEIYRGRRRQVTKQRQDKGHRAELARFIDAVSGKVEPPPLVSYVVSTRATLALAESLRTGLPVETAMNRLL